VWAPLGGRALPPPSSSQLARPTPPAGLNSPLALQSATGGARALCRPWPPRLRPRWGARWRAAAPAAGEKRWLDGQCGGPYKRCQRVKTGAAVATRFLTSPHTHAPALTAFFLHHPHPHTSCAHNPWCRYVCRTHFRSCVERVPSLCVAGVVTALGRTLVGASCSEFAVLRVANKQGRTSCYTRGFSAGGGRGRGR